MTYANGQSRSKSMSREEAGRKDGRASTAEYQDDDDRGSRNTSSNRNEDVESNNRNRYEDEKHARDGRSNRDGMSKEEAGKKGVEAHHSASVEKESHIARKAGATSTTKNPDAFKEMDERGGRSRKDER